MLTILANHINTTQTSAFPYLPLLVLTPFLLAMALPFIAKNANDKDKATKIAATTITLLTFFISIAMLLDFDFQNTAEMQFVTQISWMPQLGIHFGFGINAISLWLILLTTFLMPIVVISSFSVVKERLAEFYLLLLLLQGAMIGVFVATDILFFYICFEFTLIPLYFLIGVYGSSQRLKAARLLFFYTFTGSMITLAGILYVAWFASQITGQWSFAIQDLILAAKTMSPDQQFWVMLAMLAGFAVKVPIFPFHTWLPYAHTEAPTAGSVVLAGVLLKLGTYAILTIAIPMLPHAVLIVAPYVGMLAICGIIYTALICWVQKDIKKLVAYSSVSHLGFCVLGMFAINTQGGEGAVMYMVNHGLSTGALFICIGMIYERFHTREMQQYSGFAKVMPIWSFFMVYFCFASVGLPGLNGFIGEFLCLIGAFQSQALASQGNSVYYAAFAGVGMILAAIYLLFLIGKVVFGPVKIPDSSHGTIKDLSKREIATLVPPALACLYFGLFPSPMLRSMDAPIDQINQPTLELINQNINGINALQTSLPTALQKTANFHAGNLK